MAKVFRFHTDNNTIEDWKESQPYGSTAIEGIKDPDGAKASKEITSIPSPFARIDLIKTAFENIVNSQQLDGKTIYHKMVSDSLDVAEIFFNIDKFKDKINIIVWDPETDLNSLLNSNKPKHKLLGNTLDLFLKQDVVAYNFDKIERLYLLNYTQGLNKINIIGGTSPASLFFTSANNLSDVDIPLGKNKAFDGNFQPLYNRDFEFQKFLYGLKVANPEFHTYFRAVSDYLDLSLRKLTLDKRIEINNLTKADFESQSKILEVNPGNSVEILGFNLRKRFQSTQIIQNNSGFTIDSKKCQGIKPLVLPVNLNNDSILYTTAIWDGNNKAPYEDPKPLNQRVLPFDLSPYPYLTISDFFEDYIITTPYPIDRNKYFTGNHEAKDKSYLLPIKKAYFDYFDLKDLMGHMPDGEKTIEIKDQSFSSVRVILRIPIQNNKYITYERSYRREIEDEKEKENGKGKLAKPELDRNKGAVIENRFSITIYPFLKSTQGTPSYRVGIMNMDNHVIYSNTEYQLSFFNGQGEINTNFPSTKRSDRKNGAHLDSEYFIVSENFDFIEIRHQLAKGLLIPLFKEPSGVAKFTFAVDFGTTNTHIEYKKDDGKNTVKFEISPNDSQIESLFLMNDDTEKSFRKSNLILLEDHIGLEQVPRIVNFFPTRTAISNNEELNYNGPVYALADTNIPFYYGKDIPPRNTQIVPNLKWETVEHNEKRIKTFLEKILLLIKNKVILEKGSLDKTELIWMYPTSMPPYKQDELESIWLDLFRKHINSIHTPIKIAESITPFYYYKNEVAVTAGTNSVVSIDIGGGTTDVVIFKENNPYLITSFRFAGNALFGDAFGDRNSNMNGFVQKYFEKYSKLLNDNELNDLKDVLDVLNQNKKSEEIISFLLSLETNSEVISKNAPISFSDDLVKDKEMKVVVSLFYASILYHIAKLMKEKDFVFPRYITFSGTGSKILNLIGNDIKLQKLSQTIFDDVLGNENKVKIDLKKVNNPKEISCIGALLKTPDDDHEKFTIQKIGDVYIGSKRHGFNSTENLRYTDLNNAIYKDVAEEYISFIDWFFDLNDKFGFYDELGINPSYFDSFKNYLKEDIMDNITKGVESKKSELNGNTKQHLVEPLFFYPLIGGLNNLAYKIFQELPNNNK